MADSTEGRNRKPIPRKVRRKMLNARVSNVRDRVLETQESMASGLRGMENRLPSRLRGKRVRRFAALAIGALLLVGGGRLAYWKFDESLPSPSTLNTFMRRGTLVIKGVDGTILHQIGDVTRDKVSIDKLPPKVIQAFIAAEDRRFYQHHGVDAQGILRAVVRNISSGGLAEGGSTITQQVARMAFLNQDRSLGRKLKEAVMAQKIEREVPKDKLLEHYLNLVYLGSEAYGVADAAWVYFGKSVDKLTLGEAATIAGLPPAPSVYSPLENPDTAKERRNIVLARMLEQNFISAEEESTAKAEPINLKKSTPKNLYSESPYFTDYVQQELPKLIPQAAIDAGGLTVETTLNARWQKAAEEAVQGETGDKTGPEAFQGALVAVDPSNGEIRAMVGGKDYYGQTKADAKADAKADNKYQGDQFNRATQAMRQPGSTFKTFVYTAAIAAGFSPYKGYSDAPFFVDGYEPKNYGNSYSGYLDMRQALTKSANVVAVKVLIDVGFDPVIDLAKKMGITSKLEPVYSMALGSYEVNLLDLTSSYGTLAAKGMHTKPHGIRKVIDPQGKVLYNADFPAERAVDPDTAAITTWMLENVVNNGTGRPAALDDRSVAGKTGTSEKTRDLWFVGYIPQLVAGVWLGYDDSYPTGGASSMAADVWRRFMSKATKDIAVAKFPELPKDLDERKGSIKAKAVKPNNSYTKGIPSAKEAAQSEWNDRGSNSSSGGGGGSSYSGGGGGGGSSYSGGGGQSTYEEPRGSYSAPAPAYEPKSAAPAPPPAAPEPVYEPEPAPAAVEPAAPPMAPVPQAPAPAAPPPDPGAGEFAPVPTR
jgi:penicillin-binding protein 1A